MPSSAAVSITAARNSCRATGSSGASGSSRPAAPAARRAFGSATWPAGPRRACRPCAGPGFPGGEPPRRPGADPSGRPFRTAPRASCPPPAGAGTAARPGPRTPPAPEPARSGRQAAEHRHPALGRGTYSVTNAPLQRIGRPSGLAADGPPPALGQDGQADGHMHQRGLPRTVRPGERGHPARRDRQRAVPHRPGGQYRRPSPEASMTFMPSGPPARDLLRVAALRPGGRAALMEIPQGGGEQRGHPVRDPARRNPRRAAR